MRTHKTDGGAEAVVGAAVCGGRAQQKAAHLFLADVIHRLSPFDRAASLFIYKTG